MAPFADDIAATARAGLLACHADTAPLIAQCGRAGVLCHVDAMHGIAAVRRDLEPPVAEICRAR